jgi:ATPase subunit of ABC transporter with duplicated ATPase domains
VGSLSPGEQAKAGLARVILSNANVLLLDEPTNHLEIEAQQALAATLERYPGTVILVSHDQRFLESCATQNLDL